MGNWSKESKIGIASKVILFLISPILSFLYSLKKINTKSSYIVFFLTATLFGLSFTVISGKTESGFDGEHYRSIFEAYEYTNTLEFREKFIEYISFQSNFKDFYFDTLSFYISRFTNNYHIMFAIAAMVFSFFSLRSLRFLTREPEFTSTFSTYLLTYLFLYNSIFNINGLRFWTAAWLAVYCIFQIFRNGNSKYFFLALVTPFFHGSYFIFIFVLILGITTKKFEKAWIVLLVLSSLFSSFALEFLTSISNNFGSYLPSFINNLINSYTDESYIQSLTGSGFIWIRKLFIWLSKTYIFLLVFIFIKNNKAVKNDYRTKDLYLFLIIWITCFNFLSVIPSLGGRFFSLSYPLISYIALLHVKNTRYKNVLLLLPVIYSYFIFEQVGLYLAVLELPFYYYNPFYLIFKYIL